MKSRIGLILVTLLAVGVLAVATGRAGSGEGRGRGLGHAHGGFFDQLTEEQRDAIHEKVEEMREAGATREEIRDAVHEMLESWGIEVPEHTGRGRGEASNGEHRHRPRFHETLTEDQIDELHGMVEQMREAGASRQDIHAAVREKLAGWGVEVPDRPHDCQDHRGEIFKQLTEEQRKAIHDRVREMREAEATREEIRAAVREMLGGFGIELPEGEEGAKALDVLEGENTESATWGEIKGTYH